MAAVGTATLPDDVILEILSRVADSAVAALFRCTVACKSWRALMADPGFLRRCWQQGIGHPSSFLGVFEKSSHASWISGPPAFILATRSPLGPSHSFPASVDPSAVRLLHNAVPLASRQGLLLVQLPRQTCLQLAVCDMFAGTCDVLPLPNCAYLSISGSWIFTYADYCSNQGPSQFSSYSKNFKVLVIICEIASGEMRRRVYYFSSTESSWKSFDLIESSIFHSDLVVCRGKVHWLFEDSWNLYRFDLSNETSHGCLTKLSIPWDKFDINPVNPPCLNVTIDGKLSLLRLRRECLELEIWTHQGEKESGDGAADWLRTKVIELKPKTMPPIHEVSGMCMGERTGTLLVRDTGAIYDVPSQFCSARSYNVVPFEMDWPAFFMSRLERQRGS